MIFVGKKIGEDLGNFIFENWNCFLEHCEALFQESKIKPNDLLSILNPKNQSTQFTMECGQDFIPFLDILIKCGSDKTWLDIYYKSTDTYGCLPFSSQHPNHFKKTTPFILGCLICTIVENIEAKMKHLKNL